MEFITSISLLFQHSTVSRYNLKFKLFLSSPSLQDCTDVCIIDKEIWLMIYKTINTKFSSFHLILNVFNPLPHFNNYLASFFNNQNNMHPVKSAIWYWSKGIKIPTIAFWLHDLCIGVLTVYCHEFYLFLANAFSLHSLLLC